MDDPSPDLSLPEVTPSTTWRGESNDSRVETLNRQSPTRVGGYAVRGKPCFAVAHRTGTMNR